jgi:hypothetical protein
LSVKEPGNFRFGIACELGFECGLFAFEDLRIVQAAGKLRPHSHGHFTAAFGFSILVLQTTRVKSSVLRPNNMEVDEGFLAVKIDVIVVVLSDGLSVEEPRHFRHRVSTCVA